MRATVMKLCVIVAACVTLLCAGDALQGCSAEQRASERTALTVVQDQCSTVGSAAALLVPGVNGSNAETVCVGVDEAADLLKRLLARRAAAHAYAKAHPGVATSAVPSAALEPCAGKE